MDDHGAGPVLVVDDDVLVRSMIADEFREAGLVVVECGDADEALDVLRTGTLIALMFSDIRMPGTMDGIALARIVKRDYPAVKVVLNSSHMPDDGAPRDAFFAKPWEPSIVLRTVRALLE